ncbi:MAG TPA: carbohydrate kinase family protein [Thermoanaerobaculia bacterium]|nr:carbohydrate kinase family protein [Thermoanaerobaculia bacterium]
MTRRSVVVTGSVAYDYLMTFPGRFLEHFLPDRLHRISVSFLVDEMRRVRGGCAPNIAYGLAQFGDRPRIVASAGRDAADYRDWLAGQGIDVSALRIHDDVFTASFFVSTDRDQNQIASFYTGAMGRAGELPLFDGDGSPAWVIVSPNAPEAMVRYPRECRAAGVPFLYDPSQQVARLSGEELRDGLSGAAVLICNDYEFGIVAQKTGLSEDDLLAEVGALIVTHGPEGSTIRTADERREIPPARLRGEAVDPTGVGDAYRGALLAGMLRGFPWELSGRIASVAAVYCLEALGPQPPRFSPGEFLSRFRENFGEAEGIDALFSRAGH